MNGTATIVRVIEVIDTRTFELVAGDNGRDRIEPIAGSGDARKCDRCTRTHEIHAHVELSDGSTAVVGTSCARGESMEVQRALRTGAARATRLAVAQRELSRALELFALANGCALYAAQLPAPSVSFWHKHRESCGRSFYSLMARVDDAGAHPLDVLVDFDHDAGKAPGAQGVELAVRFWRESIERARRFEIGVKSSPESAARAIEELRLKIERATA